MLFDEWILDIEDFRIREFQDRIADRWEGLKISTSNSLLFYVLTLLNLLNFLIKNFLHFNLQNR